MKKRFMLFMIASLLLVACTQQVSVTTYDECVKAGNPVSTAIPQKCSDGTNTFENPIQIFVVGPELKDCVGVGPQECMVVNDKYFYDTIQGFEYTEGYTYTLKVNVEESKNVPADANKYIYTLVEIVNRELENTQKACTRDYRPVCGEVQIQCITTPCNPIETTFSNACEAENAGAEILYEGACQDSESNPKGACLSFDGNWLEGSQECEGMGQTQCEDLGGTFNECASACRNNPDAQFCTMQCVQVCQFN